MVQDKSYDDHEREEYVEEKGSQKGWITEVHSGGGPGTTARSRVFAEENDTGHCINGN